ncbi:UDP-N-acetylmuramoyl-L-alanyl-D-glutamate--2,6-diaminopimelate ligase [Pelomicrobium methylotrophicum]|uniref:UDP-N-acetylmuramoyl-L-alanyl-D-glutamate--2,6-diaminopimelate ligase n=1 Tax=Pelomicrobium methylotrophicum TaxID=2602750 RepID=A0A5C7EY18_9PROT|nr:UDP-N-acetylmuramoyl-L-alanyl-D-glutamate--2,6-diaminopimelate ligase [Pelomicrobium methylotrophicum]TXF13178.1 UDP-N-acetylmuramoyl-L-alanyl-D-glutamate--2,6-diaminopimelate ligase [Pelomicrobium methylotrophicum]
MPARHAPRADPVALPPAAREALDGLGVEVKRVCIDSRALQPGDTFLAYPGERQDGRRYIGEAVARGAAAVLWERAGFSWDPAWKVPNRGVHGLRGLAGWLASHVHGYPSRELWVIGVTGTNGKTSCTHWIAQSLTAAGRKAAVIGTLGGGFPEALKKEATTTTPDPVTVQRLLAEFRDAGAKAVAMEVSSHALVQERVNGVQFAVAVFTNLSRDHLDYHGTMESYARAKLRLFHWPHLQHAVLNLDDPFGGHIAEELQGGKVPVLGYGLTDDAAWRAERLAVPLVQGSVLELSERGIRMQVRAPSGSGVLESPMLGRFNAENLLAVAATLVASGIGLSQALSVLRQVRPVAGRLQQLGGGDRPLVVIDYAHTPDALAKALLCLRDVTGKDGDSRAKLICVFGCGGERDRGKRPLMGEVATRYADEVIVTSDNPRRESPQAIIADIVRGAGSNHRVIEDRATAIFEAIQRARASDVVLIAGKGHEQYQEIDGVKLPFSDEEVAARALASWGGPSQ